jgi:hypothetical protein
MLMSAEPRARSLVDYETAFKKTKQQTPNCQQRPELLIVDGVDSRKSPIFPSESYWRIKKLGKIQPSPLLIKSGSEVRRSKTRRSKGLVFPSCQLAPCRSELASGPLQEFPKGGAAMTIFSFFCCA